MKARLWLAGLICLMAVSPSRAGSPPFSRDTVAVTATVTAPGAGVAVATIASASLPQGTYEVCATAGYGSTADVIDNMRLQVGSTTVSTLYVVAAANAVPTTTCFARLTASGSQAITVNAILAGGVGTIYNATITATMVQ